MNRRDNLKLLFAGSLASGFLLTNCKPEDKAADLSPQISGGTNGGRTEAEKIRDEKLHSETFFTEEERKKLDVLVNIIMPAGENSGSATDAGVPDFIEFMMKDYVGYQTPMRGGLMWLDHYSDDNYGKKFLDLSETERMEIIELIAWPEKAKPEMEGGVKFFNMLRNLTSTGYFTSEIGFNYLGYVGNKPNVWDGVPEEVMKKHGFAYEEKYIPLYLKPEDRATVAVWDEEGNLIG
ncbi:gluconate 2-dehydrogenase subunit 3 family protein [Aquiflexum sp. TKW24L]|uniref:gluconate 2-dehydrogenase subunit 3 family protein n=1 Tax=Aquiflexum sp. TKW24L TaxID=2942212 RepID=UPI0020BD872E|nr:gluconate 2-dehydrogenase subunit 3 family protein [Aquiflexum sp. TKW24L]MCL6257972.1 gluconate 2-dehydrogenase subunit 3 family protein [Aquiflexum sp. TKW24L]